MSVLSVHESRVSESTKTKHSVLQTNNFVPSSLSGITAGAFLEGHARAVIGETDQIFQANSYKTSSPHAAPHAFPLCIASNP